jgi:UDP-N-acetylmuramate dehydrogenase
MPLKYPLYRALEGSETLYRVEGRRHFSEWQPLGEDRWLVHAHFAEIYPSQVLIQALIEGEGAYGVLSSEEWQRRRQRRVSSDGDPSSGTSLPGSKIMEMKERVDLADWTTFGLSAQAAHWMTARSDDAVRFALDWSQENKADLLVMGGGSNMLLHRDWDGLALHVGMLGIRVLKEEGSRVEVVVGAGENWHQWVINALDNGWHGLENLALIPGQVGASPMQNIGAYGVELKDRFLWLEAIHVQTGALKRFDGAACAFGYRESVFKSAEKGNWIIVRVAFALDRNAPLQTSYGAIQQELKDLPEASWTHRDVANAVMRIRSAKLPDPEKLGNAGSFFKNPVLQADAFAKLQNTHPQVAHYPQPDGTIKIAAGWLIEKAGWKGMHRGTHGVHVHQALVLVHYGGATGAEIWQLAQDIMHDVFSKYGVQLEAEVNQIGRA